MSAVDRSAALLELAPTGVLRVAVNLGNSATMVARPDGGLEGPAPDLLERLASWTGLPVHVERFGSAVEVMAGAEAHRTWDVAFLAYAPDRLDRFWFTPPYLHIEAAFAVWRDSTIFTLAQLDANDVRIATAEGAAYDLQLRRMLKHAQRVPFASQAASLAAFEESRFEAVAGIRHTMERQFGGRPDIRFLSKPLAVIRHSLATWASRPKAGALLNQFIQFALPKGPG